MLSSFVLCGAAYGALSSIDFSTADPFSIATGLGVLAAIAACGCAVAVMLSGVAVIRSRPRTTAMVALLCSLTFPVVAIVLGVIFGMQGLEHNMTENVSALGGAAARLVDLLGSWGAPVGPLRDIVHSVRGS